MQHCNSKAYCTGVVTKRLSTYYEPSLLSVLTHYSVYTVKHQSVATLIREYYCQVKCVKSWAILTRGNIFIWRPLSLNGLRNVLFSNTRVITAIFSIYWAGRLLVLLLPPKHRPAAYYVTGTAEPRAVGVESLALSCSFLSEP